MIESRAPTPGGLSGIREIVRFVNRQKLIIFVPAVLIAGIAGTVASVMVPRYTANAALTLDVGKVQLVEHEVLSPLPLENSTLRSELDVIHSRSLNNEVGVLLGLRSDPAVAREVAAWQSQSWGPVISRVRRALSRFLPGIVGNEPVITPTITQAQLTDWLVGNLSVSNDSRSLTILVSFTSQSPERAAQIANEVAKTYLDDQVSTKQVILVTSAQPGDGKTSFCTGLARSLAKSRMRVLVIDADPYRSQVATAFGAPTTPAFEPTAGQHVPLGDIVRADTKSAAHFLPAPSEDDLHLLLHSGGFATLIEEARQAYDIVIIDTPPVMTRADAAVIGRFADTCLLLVRWGRTSWDEMTAAVGFLRLCRVRLDGIVMVGADTGSAGYGQVAGYDTAPSDYRLMRPPSDRSLTEAE